MYPSDGCKQDELKEHRQNLSFKGDEHKHEAKKPASQKLCLFLIVTALAAAGSYLCGYYTVFTCFLGFGTLTFVWYGLDFVRRPVLPTETSCAPTDGKDCRVSPDFDLHKRKQDNPESNQLHAKDKGEAEEAVKCEVSKPGVKNEDEEVVAEETAGTKHLVTLNAKEESTDDDATRTKPIIKDVTVDELVEDKVCAVIMKHEGFQSEKKLDARVTTSLKIMKEEEKDEGFVSKMPISGNLQGKEEVKNIKVKSLNEDEIDVQNSVADTDGKFPEVFARVSSYSNKEKQTGEILEDASIAHIKENLLEETIIKDEGVAKPTDVQKNEELKQTVGGEDFKRINDENELKPSEDTFHSVKDGKKDEAEEKKISDDSDFPNCSHHQAVKMVKDEERSNSLSKKWQLGEELSQEEKYTRKSGHTAKEEATNDEVDTILEDKISESAQETIECCISSCDTDNQIEETLDVVELSNKSEIPRDEEVECEKGNHNNDNDENSIEETFEGMRCSIETKQLAEKRKEDKGVDLSDGEAMRQVHEKIQTTVEYSSTDKQDEGIFQHRSSTRSVKIREEDELAAKIEEVENNKPLSDTEKSTTDQTANRVSTSSERENKMEKSFQTDRVEFPGDKMVHDMKETMLGESKSSASSKITNADSHGASEIREENVVATLPETAHETDEVDGIPVSPLIPSIEEKVKDSLDAFEGVKKPTPQPTASEQSINPPEPSPSASKRWKPAGAVSMFGGLDPTAVLSQLKSTTSHRQEGLKKDQIPPTAAAKLFRGDKEGTGDEFFGDQKKRAPPPVAPKTASKFATQKLPAFNPAALLPEAVHPKLGKMQNRRSVDFEEKAEIDSRCTVANNLSNLNPAAMLPGAIHPRLGNMQKERSVDFDEPADTETLSSAAKDRPKLNRRRPSTRKARLEAAANSSFSFEDSTETDYPAVAGLT